MAAPLEGPEGQKLKQLVFFFLCSRTGPKVKVARRYLSSGAFPKDFTLRVIITFGALFRVFPALAPSYVNSLCNKDNLVQKLAGIANVEKCNGSKCRHFMM